MVLRQLVIVLNGKVSSRFGSLAEDSNYGSF